MKDEKLYNSRIIDTYIKLLKCKYVFVNINELLNYADMKTYEVADQGHWFTQDQIDRFHEKMAQLTGNRNIAREAGRYAASPDALGVMRQYTLGLVSPVYAFALFSKVTSNFTRSSVYNSKKLAANKVEVTVTPKEGIEERPFQCENRMGFFEALVMGFNYNIPKVVHNECIFNGGKICRYVITWERVFSDVWKRIRFLSSIFLIFLFFWYLLERKEVAFSIILPLFVLIMSILTIVIEKLEKKELIRSLSNLQGSTENLIEQININYNNSLLGNEIGQIISKHRNVDDIIKSVIEVLEKRLDFDRGLILLQNKEKNRLIYKAAFGYSKEHLGFVQKSAFHLDRPESKGPFVVAFRERKPLLINDIDEIEKSLTSRSFHFVKKLGVQSFICCPIICEGESIGILAVDNLKTKRPLLQSDVSLLMGIAPVLGVSIYNAELLEASRRQMKSILQVLAASTDARDPLTAGHSETVTEYALGICHEMDLPQEYCEMIRVAAVLHDYGKIGVPDAILKKDGKLTDEEYEIVKTHSEKTRQILEQINFEGIFKQVPEIAGAHHEKIDGSGYPRGLSGKEIPLGAKIIAVADFFEAITAKRHYRGPMPMQIAFDLLRQDSGIKFDKKVVESFIKYYEKTFPEKLNGDSFNMRAPRVPFVADIVFHVDNKKIHAKSIDLSENGIFIATKVKVPENSVLSLSLSMPGDQFPKIETKARVAWINENVRKKEDYPFGLGLEFFSNKITQEIIKYFNGSNLEKVGSDENPLFSKEYILRKLG